MFEINYNTNKDNFHPYSFFDEGILIDYENKTQLPVGYIFRKYPYKNICVPIQINICVPIQIFFQLDIESENITEAILL